MGEGDACMASEPEDGPYTPPPTITIVPPPRGIMDQKRQVNTCTTV